MKSFNFYLVVVITSFVGLFTASPTTAPSSAPTVACASGTYASGGTCLLAPVGELFVKTFVSICFESNAQAKYATASTLKLL